MKRQAFVPGRQANFVWDAFDVYLFDIDGTLLSCRDAVHYFAFCETLSAIAGRPVNLEGVTAHGNTDVGILRDAFALAGIPEKQWRPHLDRMRQDMCRYVQTHEHEFCIEVPPGVRAVLESLRARGAMLGVATGNLHGIGEAKLRRAGLLEYFSFAAWSDAYEHRRDVFASAVEAARKLAGQNATICAVGDTPADIVAARENNLPILAVATGIHSAEQLRKEQPDRCVSSLEELIVPDKMIPAQPLPA